MKTNIRFVVAAVILAAVAALSFSRGAWAGPLMAGTVPGCGMSDTGSGDLDTCYANVDFAGLPGGLNATLTDYGNHSSLFPNPVSDGGGGPLVALVVVDAAGNEVQAPALMTLCFPDPTGVSIIFRWWTVSDWKTYYGVDQAAGWMFYPSFRTNGQVCSNTWLTGVFREIY